MTTKKDLDIIETIFNARRKPDNLLRKLSTKRKDFLFRQTSYITTIIYNNVDYSFPNRTGDGFPINHLWVFRSVKMDARKFLAAFPDWEAPEKLPTNKTNYDYEESKYGRPTGTDINSAYWVMAYKMGIISESTYQKAGDEKYKKVRLAALAVLGRNTAYQKYEKGELKKNDPLIIQPEHPGMRSLYKAIRYNCYDMMNEMATMLGDEFEAYRTDCIYYRNTPENIKKVHDYLDREGFTYKQLVYPDQVQTEQEDENQEDNLTQ